MVYFFAVVVVLGGMGWIIPLYRHCFSSDMKAVSDLPSALSSFFLALLAGAMADIVLDDGESKGDSSQEPNKGFRVFVLGLSLVGIPLAYAGIQRTDTNLAYFASVLGMMISLFLWWILNADKDKWQDRTPEPIVATGGTVSVDLKGSTDGLTV